MGSQTRKNSFLRYSKTICICAFILVLLVYMGIFQFDQTPTMTKLVESLKVKDMLKESVAIASINTSMKTNGGKGQPAAAALPVNYKEAVKPTDAVPRSKVLVGDADKCVIEHSKEGTPQIAKYHTDNPSFYEICLKADSGPGPVTPYGICMPLKLSDNSIEGELPPFHGNATVTLKQIWKHDNWDYSKELSCKDLWVDEIACQWSIQGSPGKNQVEKTPPIPSSFFDKYDSVFFLGDSTVGRFYTAFRSRCLHSLDKGSTPGNVPFKMSKIRTDKKTMCGDLLITYVVNVGNPSSMLRDLPVRNKTLIVFNLAHTYMWFDKTGMSRVLTKIEQTMQSKNFPNLIFLYAPAMNTRAWNNSTTGLFLGYKSRCTFNNVMVKKRHQEALDLFKESRTPIPVIDVFYESLASIPECAMDGIHYCQYVYNLMVDKLLDLAWQGTTKH